MDAISPTLADAYSLLCGDIFLQLDEAEYLAQFEKWTDKDEALVRKVIPDLTTVIRGLVVLHQASDTGQCTTCETVWPCRVTESIHSLVKNPERVFHQILDHVRYR